MSLIKGLFCVCGLLIAYSNVAQTIPEYRLQRIRITLQEKQIIAEINPVSPHLKIKASLWYYWYDANSIHNTQGGFSGKLLDGSYEEQYLNKSIGVQGHFKKGLKDGDWKKWDEQGNLTAIEHWKNGIQLSGERLPFWKRLPLIRKRHPKTSQDTAKKPV